MTRLGGGIANQMRALGYDVRPPANPKDCAAWTVHPPHSDTILLAKDAAEGWKKADQHWRQQCIAKIEPTTMQPSPWPLRGYAPGNYWCACRSCGEKFDGDKRATECLSCAVRGARDTAERLRKLEAALLPFARATSITTGWNGEHVFATLHYPAEATETIYLAALQNARGLLDITASGIEAPSGGETGTGSTVGESPASEAGDAQ